VDHSYRLSDADRERTATWLRGHLLAGRLTLDEFSERVETVYAARFGQELVPVREGLPDTPVAPGPSRRKATRLTFAAFGHVGRRGRLRLPRRSAAISAFADIDFDLREAEVDRPETSIVALAWFGNIDIYVPDGVNVDLGGLTVFGHSREWGPDIAGSDAPTIHVRTLGWFGTIDLWRVPQDVGGSYSDIFRQLQGRRRRLTRLRLSR
jgi:hypothetical protein